MDALMVMPRLILQRSSVSLSHCQRVDHVQRRLQQWFDGNFEELHSEGRVIQKQLRLQERKSRRLQVDEDDHLAQTFARQMNGGKVKAALRLKSEGERGNLLSLDDHMPNGENGS